MTDVFQVAAPKAEPKTKAPSRVMDQALNGLGAPVEPKPARQTPAKITNPSVDLEPIKKTRRKRTPRVPDLLDEHMLFMKLYNELWSLPKKPRERLLGALTRQLG